MALLLLVSTFFGTDQATVLTLQNRCTETLWPGILAIAGDPQVKHGDFKLNQGQTVSITAPTSWWGKVWARTECSSDKAGRLKCATGDCGGSIEECGRLDRTPPPTTAANFLLNGSMAMDYYSLNLLAGFNIPISIVPSGGSGDCRPISCLTDLDTRCPSALQVRSNGRVVACKSACLAFNQPEYCCTGAYESPDACKPSSYSQIFKDSCPAAFTYPHDDPSSFVTCKGANYLISFC